MPEPLERRARAISALDSRLAPEPQNRCPNQLPDGRRAGRGPTSSESPVTPIGPVVAVDDEQVEQLAALAQARQAGDVGLGLLDALVRPPREVARHGRVARELEQRAARRRVGRSAASAWGRQIEAADGVGRVRRLAPAVLMRPMLLRAGRARRCSTTSTATSPALEAVLADARGAGRRALPARRRLRAVRRAGRPRRSRACASSTARPGSAATASAGPPHPDEAPDNPVVPGAIARAPRRARRRRHRRRPRRAPDRASARRRRAVVHGSPVCDVRSFLPTPADDEDGAARRRRTRRA